jgi:hypothetical protein
MVEQESQVHVDRTATHEVTADRHRTYVYAIGRIQPRFPSLGVEKEFAQATGRSETAGLSDRQAVHAVLTDPSNRYLARKLCWVLSVEGQDTYVLVPREPMDLDLLIEAVRPSPHTSDIDVVIGVLGPLAPPDFCNGLVVPMVVLSQVYSFDSDALVAAIPQPEDIPEDQFRTAAEDLFQRVQQLADNAGATDEHRALNYLAVRYPAIYSLAADKFSQNSSLTAVDVTSSRLSGLRNIVNVVFTFTERRTGVIDKCAVRVDTTEEFPFLVTKLQPHFDR